jgi:hypothetical protein
MINEILEKIIDALTKAQDLKTFCNSNFSKLFTIYKGINPEDAPTENMYPLIAILGIQRKDRGISVQKEEFTINLTTVIKKDSETSTSIENITVVEYPGLAIVEEFKDKIEKVILGKNFGGGFSCFVSGDSVSESFYPYYESTINLTFSRSTQKRLGNPLSQ